MFKKNQQDAAQKDVNEESGSVGSKAPLMPPRHDGFRPAAPRRAHEFTGKASDDRPVGSYGENKKLIIGREIVLSGEISACETLIVEGCVETSKINDCRQIEIADGGIYKGEAQIEIAEIGGHFEGAIFATNLLTIRSTGSVTGTIRAKQIEVERGGRISGQIEMIVDEQEE